VEPFFYWYIAAWGTACAAAVVLVVREPGAYSIASADYWRVLSVRWKLVTFAIAALGMTFVAPYTGDPTWDYYDAAFQSVFTYLGAPWAVGTLYLALRGHATAKQAYVAACLWLFSACWSYDLYILLRDGRYPDTWLVNIAASSVLYLSAGMLWNLDWREGRGVTFSFLETDWPHVPPHAALGKFVWFALPFMVIAAASVLYFVLPTVF
jgi:hypothetical protein